MSGIVARSIVLRRGAPMLAPATSRFRIVSPALPAARCTARRPASTQPDSPPDASRLRRLILEGRLSDVLAVVRSGSVEFGKPEIRDILCRVGEGAEAEDDATRDTRKHLLTLLVAKARDLGLTAPDATLIARAGALVPWGYDAISQFIAVLRQSGVKLDSKLYEHFMDSLHRVGDAAGAEQLLRLMEEDGIKGTTAIYGTLSEIFVAQGKREALQRLLGGRD